MEIGAILFSLAMILFVGALLVQPLTASSRGGFRDTSRKLSALQAERDRVLDSIEETDSDHSMGKVSEDDYQRQRQALVLEGADILRSIDELQHNGSDDEPATELEAAVAQLRGKSSADGSQTASDESDGELQHNGSADDAAMELEVAVMQLRGKSPAAGSQIAKGESDLGEGACPACGEEILLGDRFCINCGATLEEQVA